MEIKWHQVKVISILIAFTLGLFLHRGKGGPIEPVITPMDLVFIFVGLVGGLQFVIGLQVINPKSDQKWALPSWRENPFNLGQPPHFFHFVGYLSMSFGIASLLGFSLGRSGQLVEILIPLVIGLGVLVGVRLSKLIFSNKFSSDHIS